MLKKITKAHTKLLAKVTSWRWDWKGKWFLFCLLLYDLKYNICNKYQNYYIIIGFGKIYNNEIFNYYNKS